MREFFSTLLYSRTLRQLSSIAWTALFLAACSSGGGDGGGGTPPTATPTTGTFVDSPVDGLHYKSPPSNPAGGLTNNGGQYQCQPGDNVTFDLAGKVIGNPQPCSSDVVTAVSVFGASSITDNRVVNLTRLLLTLGGPPNANNIIQLPSTLPPLPVTLDFSLSTTAFAATILAAGGLALLVPEAAANQHLQTSFKTLSVTIVNNGTVTSNPLGITCTAGTCSYDFVTDTAVTLTASGASFTGWSDACSGNSPTCVVTLTADTTTVTASFVSTTTGVVYPLTVGPTGRYLVDQNGVPFLILGESPQAMIGDLSEADAELFLANRKSHGFNTVWINLLCASYTRCNADGTTFDRIAPFTAGNDLSTPNEAYFARADRMLQLAAKYGFLVILDPAETGSWLSVLQSNGATKARAYGQYLGTRYKDFANIVWMSGNDFYTWRNPSDDVLVREVAMGIKDTDPKHIHTVELHPDTSSLDDSPWAPIISLNAAYTYHPTYGEVLYAYNQSASMPMPVFMVEANYEFENEAGTNPAILRRQEYWTSLSGATGQLYGNGYTWGFSNDWKNQLDKPGAVQIAYVKALFEPRAWFELVPDQANTVVTAGYGTFSYSGSIGDNDYVTAARTPNGKLVMAYVPSARTVTVDMSQLSGPATARWYDPVVGTFTSIAGPPFINTGSRPFTTPGTNAGGDDDWVLILEVQ